MKPSTKNTQQNHVFGQVMVVSKRLLKDRSKQKKGSLMLSRPAYVLTIKSHHSPGNEIHPDHRLGGGNYALISITIPKTTAEALVQDHGAKWDDSTMADMG
jgi:hypothetical protein